MKIQTSFGKFNKEIVLEESFSAVRKCFQIQLDMAKTSEKLNDQANVEINEVEIKKTINIAKSIRLKCIVFISEVTDVSKDELKDLDQKDLYGLVNLICINDMGISKEKGAKTSIGEAIYSLKNAIEDLDYEEQIAFTQFHILPDDFEKQNFKKLQTVLKANAPEDRIQDPIKLLKSFGISPNGSI